jgi:hypothetical protein
MGLHFSRIWERMFGKKEMRILMVGLDAAGKVRIILNPNSIDFCYLCSNNYLFKFYGLSYHLFV